MDEDELLRSVTLQNARVILAAAHLGDWSWSAADDLVRLSDRAADVFGLHRGVPVTWTSMRELLHPDDRERARLAVEHSVAARADYQIEYRVLRDGAERWIAANGRAVYGADGGVRGMIGVVQDVTERKRVEEMLRQREELLRASFVQAAVGMVLSAPDGRMLEVNRRVCEILGYSEDELKSMKAFDLSHPEHLENTRADVDALLAGRISHYAKERRYVRKDGAVIWSLTSVGLIRDAQGRPHRFISVLEDITQRKQAEEALRRSGELKDEFLATLSHELRTPLSAILGWTQVLRRRPGLDPDLERGLETIERNARMQTQLIEDLLDMSRITSGNMRLDVQLVDPASFVEAAVATVLPALDAKELRLEKTIDPAAGPVNGDPGRLQQVVWNLLSNAVKFTPRGGKVQVVLKRVSSHIELSVSDSGIGIAPDFVGQVFERFRQADATTTRRYGGLGLGLSIVKHLVEQHGGSVRAQSDGAGRGATFTVELPIAAVSRPAMREQRMHPRTVGDSLDYRLADLAGLRFLIVDDEPDARALVQRVLRDCGAQAEVAANVEEALRVLRSVRPHVVLCDIGMPDADGYELLRRVREESDPQLSRVPAIALTAFARSEDRTRALRAGFSLHLAKPVEPAELVATVASLATR